MEIEEKANKNHHLTKRDEKHLNRKDTILTKIMLKAERKKIPVSDPWTTTIHQAWNTVKLFKTWYNSRIKGREEKMSNKLKKLAADVNEEYQPHQPTASIKKKLNKALKKIRRLRKDAKPARIKFLKEAAEVAKLSQKNRSSRISYTTKPRGMNTQG